MNSRLSLLLTSAAAVALLTPLLSVQAQSACEGKFGRARAECLSVSRASRRDPVSSASSSSAASAPSSSVSSSSVSSTSSSSSVSSTSSASSASSTSSLPPTPPTPNLRREANCVDEHKKWHADKNKEFKTWQKAAKRSQADRDAWNVKMTSDHQALHKAMKVGKCSAN